MLNLVFPAVIPVDFPSYFIAWSVLKYLLFTFSFHIGGKQSRSEQETRKLLDVEVFFLVNLNLNQLRQRLQQKCLAMRTK